MNALRKLPFAPVVGLMFGLVAAILVIATPQFLFERAIAASGLPGLISAAAPPLGEKARVATAILAAALVGGLVFTVLARLEEAAMKRRPLGRGIMPGPARVGAGLERIHVAPPRPIFAGSDLGAPFMSDEAMSVAREELLLDPAMVEAEPAATGQARPQSVPGLLSHLEDTLVRHRARVGRAPPVPGDIASLRAALGMSVAA